MIERSQVTQPIIDDCIQTSFDTLTPVKLLNDATDWVVLKWRGNKPAELWDDFPVYSDQEMRNIILSNTTR